MERLVLNQVTTTTDLIRAYAHGEPVCIEVKNGIVYGFIHSLEREDGSGHSHNVTMHECSISGVRIGETLNTYHVRFGKTVLEQ